MVVAFGDNRACSVAKDDSAFLVRRNNDARCAVLAFEAGRLASINEMKPSRAAGFPRLRSSGAGADGHRAAHVGASRGMRRAVLIQSDTGAAAVTRSATREWPSVAMRPGVSVSASR
ncbi:hypothetical protein [Burkholderia vietnamiensis]|uniref:hypothetical protein n=1 Tax=Burkholderia vietnamiensis TaxID=60552 RepID=UPI000D974423|nr:hypothetical protein [Burkholderia vietnamiensis]GBH28255.1 hypothetical protein BvRS1_53040 [Burkholderia vietnamiensis]